MYLAFSVVRRISGILELPLFPNSEPYPNSFSLLGKARDEGIKCADAGLRGPAGTIEAARGRWRDGIDEIERAARDNVGVKRHPTARCESDARLDGISSAIFS